MCSYFDCPVCFGVLSRLLSARLELCCHPADLTYMLRSFLTDLPDTYLGKTSVKART
jgi:hypothetical protein